VFSVARSPLKHPEDFLVGQSVVFSGEALVRGHGEILPRGEACVVGFGKLGNSIARILHAKHVRVTVYDEDPVRTTQALAQGFRVATSLPEALSQSKKSAPRPSTTFGASLPSARNCPRCSTASSRAAT
jgi:adenosylhomocysteinase